MRYKDEDLRMPPDGKKLTGAQVADLEAWVRMGAPLPGAGVQEDKIKASARTHWAFQPVKRPAIPTVKNQRWAQSPVDAFILAKLEPAGMQPAQPADKRTLIRRATYDLIGLPPTPEEVAAFVADESPDAFATVVDRLLALAALRRTLGPTLAGCGPIRQYRQSLCLHLSRLRDSRIQ